MAQDLLQMTASQVRVLVPVLAVLFLAQLPDNAPGKVVEHGPIIGASAAQMGDLDRVPSSWF